MITTTNCNKLPPELSLIEKTYTTPLLYCQTASNPSNQSSKKKQLSGFNPIETPVVISDVKSETVMFHH